MKILLASLLALSPMAAIADDGIMWKTTSRTCYRETYREEYVPGTKSAPGYVSSYTELIEVPCKSDPIVRRETVVEYDNNDCSDGKIAGALLGGGAGCLLYTSDAADE